MAQKWNFLATSDERLPRRILQKSVILIDFKGF
jgi:hypothetical protein